MTTPRVGAPSVVPRRALSLRTTLLLLSFAALAYIALVGIDIGVRIGPGAARVARQSGAALTEFQESRRRTLVLDNAMTDLWRLLGEARRAPVATDTLELIRFRLQDMEESPRTLTAMLSDASAPPGLLTALALGMRRETELANAMLAGIAALQMRDVVAAERLLRRADSLDAPLAEAMANATTIALRHVRDHEANLVEVARNTTRIVWVWLIAGAALVALLTWYLHRRLYTPLAELDAGLARLATGDLGVTLGVRYNDELGRLSDHFDRMTAVLRQRAADEDQRMAVETAARTRLILDSALDAVLVMDARGAIRDWNPQAEVVFGWRRDEVIGLSIGDEMLPQEFRAAYRDGVLAGAPDATRGVLNRRVETVAVRRDGTRFPVEVAVTPIRRGTEVEFSAFVRDISERRAAQAALSASEARYRAAFEQAAVGMAEVSIAGRFVRVNNTLARTVGYAPSELEGRPFADITHPGDIDGDRAAFSDLMSGRVAYVHREKRYVRKDGSIAWVQLDSALVRDPHGAPAYALSVVQDVSERKRLEDELHQIQKMEAVGRLAGGIAHDFNNLLSGIMGYADLLQHADGVNAQVRDDARAIIATAQQGADLAQNLLTMARRSPQRKDRINLHDVVDEVRKLISRTFDRSIEVEAKLASDKLIVLGDRSQLTNALLNLTINAKDAMPDGGRLQIEARHEDLDAAFCSHISMHAQPGRYVIVTVRDTGTGMTPETKARIFEPFFTTKTQGKGTGLGLAMVYGTVGSHDGMIDVESAIGAGSAFTIYLPSRDDLEESGAKEARTLVAGGGRVLVADDESTVRAVVSRMLERLGYTVDSVADGELAVARVREAPDAYSAAILDGDMPRMNGRDAARQIRAIAPGLPMLYASGNYDADTARDLESLGFAGAIAKPYTLAELSRVLAATTQKNEKRNSTAKEKEQRANGK